MTQVQLQPQSQSTSFSPPPSSTASSTGQQEQSEHMSNDSDEMNNDDSSSSHHHTRIRNSICSSAWHTLCHNLGCFCCRVSSPSPWIRKPLWLVFEEEKERELQDTVTLHRHLTLFDLVAVGVGGTVGSGIFVLAGYIAHHYAGPATALSFCIAGVAACCSGLCYAELSGRIPAAGSTYIYAYVCLGELPAVLAAACLTLEYGVSGAAVARSWGDKVITWLEEQWHWEDAGKYLYLGNDVNVMAFFISSISVALLLHGVQESKRVTNVFATLKVILVLFMTIGGYFLLDTSNFRPFLPMGAAGVLRGATSSFFGFLGYDEVCCISGEALNPHRDMPRAVLWTLAIITVLYISAALALTGMEPYASIDDTSGFPAAFKYNNVEWAAQLSAAGEVITLPVVVVITLMAQPRLFLALARDGLMPKLFARLDDRGNLFWGALVSGVVMTVVATFVPFSYLDDLISSGILVAFCMTDSCLILMRHEAPVHRPKFLSRTLIVYHILCLTSGMLLSHVPQGAYISIPFLLLTAAMPLLIHMRCPKSKTFGGSILHRHNSNLEATVNSSGNTIIGVMNDDTNGDNNSSDPHPENSYFQTPCVPFLPCLGIFINWYLVSRLELAGLGFLLLYLGLVAVWYFTCCAQNSIGNSMGWRRGGIYQGVAARDADEPSDSIMLRTISLPNVKPKISTEEGTDDADLPNIT